MKKYILGFLTLLGIVLIFDYILFNSALKQKLVPTATSTFSISGSLHLNGHFPDTSTISIMYKKDKDASFSAAIENMHPVDQTSWIIPNLTKNNYDVKA